MSTPYEDLGRLFEQQRQSATTTPVQEKAVPLRGRTLHGNFYVRVDDVVALLEANRVLPKATRLLKARVRP